MNYPMRKSKREITDKSALETIIQNSLVCRLALVDGDRPYIVPLNFGYRSGTLYFHSAPQGRKITLMKMNPNVCFELEADTEIIQGEKACDWSMKYLSIIGYGKASLVEDDQEKRTALNIIMQHYSRGGFSFPDEIVRKTAVIKVEIEHMRGKQSKK